MSYELPIIDPQERGGRKQENLETPKNTSVSNQFEALGDQPEEITKSSPNEKQQSQNRQEEKDENAKATNNAMAENSNEDLKRDTWDEVEDMDIGDLDLDGIERACEDAKKGYVPQERVILLKEVIIKEREINHLGINPGSHKDYKRKHEEIVRKSGRKSNRQRIAVAGLKLVESGQYPAIRVTLGL